MSAPTATPETTAEDTQSPPRENSAPDAHASAGAPAQPHFVPAVPLTYVIEQKLRNHSIIVLIFGVAGLAMALPLVGSIVAWIWGNNILAEARMNGIHEEAVSLAKIGRLLGIIGVVLVVVIPLAVLVATLLGITLAAIFSIPFAS
ncbi:MAG: hypothetical protein Q4C87_12360 [Actinomycetaceae bacterium]|nr:hypothetical protein [Actinomycetaceae bacterium]